jgi:transcriptional regulator with XRE-family HTH domain
LLRERENRKINQDAMAELLDMTTSAYARLERGETSLKLEKLLEFSEKLDIPVHEFLPETISIYNQDSAKQGNKGHIGLLIGNVFNYSSDKADDGAHQLLAQENTHLKEKNALLESRIKDLEARIGDLERRLAKGNDEPMKMPNV